MDILFCFPGRVIFIYFYVFIVVPLEKANLGSACA